MNKWKNLNIEEISQDEDFVEEFFLKPNLGDDFRKEIVQDVVVAESMPNDKGCVCFEGETRLPSFESNREKETIAKHTTLCNYAKKIDGLYTYHYFFSLHGFTVFFQGCAYEKAESMPSLEEEWKKSREEVIKKARSSNIPKKGVVCTRQKLLLFHKSKGFNLYEEDYSDNNAVKFIMFWFRDLISRILGICRYEELKDALFLDFIDTMVSFLAREFPPTPISLQEWQIDLFHLFSSIKVPLGFFCGENSVIAVIPGRFCILRVIVTSPNSVDNSEIGILPVLCEDVGVNNVVVLKSIIDYIKSPLKDRMVSVLKHDKDLSNQEQFTRFAHSIWLVLNSPDHLSEIFSLVREGGTIQ